MRKASKKIKRLLFFVLIFAVWPAAAYQVYGAIGEKWRALGAEGGILGAPVSNEGDSSGGGRIQSFARGHVVWSPTTGAHTMFGSIYEKWKSLGGVSTYGFPITDESPGARGGRYNDFNRGNSIYWSMPTGAHAVYGFILNKWRELGGDNSFLKYPTTDELPGANGGRMSAFEGGVIYWHPNYGAHTVYGRILEEWSRHGREAGTCGYPTSDEIDFDDNRTTGEYGNAGEKRFRRSSFSNGEIVWSKGRDKFVQTCSNQTPTTNTSTGPQPGEPCAVSVTIANHTCLNADSTQSSLTPGGTTTSGCGADEQKATERAKASFQTFSCISEGDTPAPGCCTYTKQTIAGCLCQ